MSQTKRVERVYALHAKWYDYTRKFWNHFFAASAEKVFEELMVKYIKTNADILDVGVGTGLNIERFLKLEIPFNFYTGIDLSTEMLVAASAKFSRVANISFRQSDIMTEELEGKYDAIVSTLLFSHLSQQDEVLKKILRVLKPDGSFLLMFFGCKPIPRLIDRIALQIYRRILKFDCVPTELIKKFPASEENHHFPCLGGQMSVYVFKKM